MLTNFIKLLQEKCFQYWPSETGTKHFGNVEVVLMNETLLPDWSITEFCISLVSVVILFLLPFMKMEIAFRIIILGNIAINNEDLL